jgi:hypothetical protein
VNAHESVDLPGMRVAAVARAGRSVFVVPFSFVPFSFVTFLLGMQKKNK